MCICSKIKETMRFSILSIKEEKSGVARVRPVFLKVGATAPI